MRLLVVFTISIGLAACHSALPDDGPVGNVVARITQVPDKVGCVSITAVGTREVFHTFDVIPGQSAMLELGDLPVGNVAFSAAAYGQSCDAISGVQPSWSTTSPFVAAIIAGQVTALTLTLEPTGGAVIGIDFGDGGAPADLSPCIGCYDDGGVDMAYVPWDMAYTPADLAF
jgi:hypothetical protein